MLVGGGSAVQSDWNVTSPTDASYIKNRPFYDDSVTTEHLGLSIDNADEIVEGGGLKLAENFNDCTTDITVNELYDVTVILDDDSEVKFTNIEAQDVSSAYGIPNAIALVLNESHNEMVALNAKMIWTGSDIAPQANAGGVTVITPYPDIRFWKTISVTQTVDNLQKIPQRFVDTDWNELSGQSVSFIKNKPFGEFIASNTVYKSDANNSSFVNGKDVVWCQYDTCLEYPDDTEYLDFNMIDDDGDSHELSHLIEHTLSDERIDVIDEWDFNGSIYYYFFSIYNHAHAVDVATNSYEYSENECVVVWYPDTGYGKGPANEIEFTNASISYVSVKKIDEKYLPNSQPQIVSDVTYSNTEQAVGTYYGKTLYQASTQIEKRANPGNLVTQMSIAFMNNVDLVFMVDHILFDWGTTGASLEKSIKGNGEFVKENYGGRDALDIHFDFSEIDNSHYVSGVARYYYTKKN